MEGKKIAFGFSKVKKISALVKPVVVEKQEIEFVDSFDGEKGKFSYQGSVREEKVKKPLVIPLVGTRSAYDVIKNKLERRDGTTDSGIETQSIKTEPDDSAPKNSTTEIKDVKPSIEDLAISELVKEAKESGPNVSKKGLVIATDIEKPSFDGEKQSTLEDYENVPIEEYGLALLRGMGWSADTGIGKEQRIVAPITNKIRPKGLGLGAEGSKMSQTGADVDLKKGSIVKVLGGPYKGIYGTVEGIDGDCGRVFIKLEDKGSVSLSETVVSPVTKKEYEDRNNGEGSQANNKATALVSSSEKKFGINVLNNQIKKESINKGDGNTSRHSSKERGEKSNKHISSSHEESKSRSKHKKEKKRRYSSESSLSSEDSFREKKKKSSSSESLHKKKHTKKDRNRSRSRDRSYKKKKKRRNSRSDDDHRTSKSNSRDTKKRERKRSSSSDDTNYQKKSYKRK